MKRKLETKEKPITFRILWSRVKKLNSAWAHIRCSISDSEDTVKCVVCGEVKTLNADKSSLVLKMARTHYYRHKLFGADDSELGGVAIFRYLGIA